MKVTTSAGPVTYTRLEGAPVAGGGRVKGGAGVPRASMVDSMAMPASLAFRQLEAGLRDRPSELGRTPDVLQGPRGDRSILCNRCSRNSSRDRACNSRSPG